MQAKTFVQHTYGHSDVCIIETEHGNTVVMIIAKTPVTPGEKPPSLKLKHNSSHRVGELKVSFSDSDTDSSDTTDSGDEVVTPELKVPTMQSFSRWCDPPQCAAPIRVSREQQYYPSFSHVTHIE